MNLRKGKSLYEKGLRPLIYSAADVGWKRLQDPVSYYPNDNAAGSYVLEFCITTDEEDTFYLAHAFPYTYSTLQTFISKLNADSSLSKHLKHSVIGTSVAGNNLDVLCITQLAESPEELKERKSIVVTARVHPGESCSSYLAQGLVEFLVCYCLGNT
jgi:murein tripeptide amidase MpaA